jgi:DNA-binding CsgD family transcriptional regulator
MLDANIDAFPIQAKRLTAKGRRGCGLPKDSLSSREREICELVMKGVRLKEVALQLGIRVSTATSHITNAYRKLGVTSSTRLVLHFAKPNGGREVDTLPDAWPTVTLGVNR